MTLGLSKWKIVPVKGGQSRGLWARIRFWRLSWPGHRHPHSGPPWRSSGSPILPRFALGPGRHANKKGLSKGRPARYCSVLSIMCLESKKGGLLLSWLRRLAGCAALATSSIQAVGDDSPPPVQREFRGLWVATVENIDWPSQRGLDSTRQKQEVLAILDRAAALRLNVVVLQGRA